MKAKQITDKRVERIIKTAEGQQEQPEMTDSVPEDAWERSAVNRLDQGLTKLEQLVQNKVQQSKENLVETGKSTKETAKEWYNQPAQNQNMDPSQVAAVGGGAAGGGILGHMLTGNALGTGIGTAAGGAAGIAAHPENRELVMSALNEALGSDKESTA